MTLDFSASWMQNAVVRGPFTASCIQNAEKERGGVA
jgi:hypothetical protein